MTARASLFLIIVSIFVSGFTDLSPRAGETVPASPVAAEETQLQESQGDDDADDAEEYGAAAGPGYRESLLGPLTLSGSATQRYRYRRSGSESDQDVYGALNLNASYPADPPLPGAPFRSLNLNLQATYNLDIDSFAGASGTGSSSFFPFADVSNTFGSRFHGFVHSAYGEVQDLAFLERVRLGRQQIYREEGILFDGAHVRTERWKTLSLDLYGGIPAHLYESSSSGDAFGGAGIESRPFSNLILGADYFYLRDDSDTTTDSEDQLYLLRGRYRITHEWTVRGSASWVDTRDRRQLLEVVYLSRTSGLLANLRLLRQNGVVDFQTSELSPYIFIQGEYAPYYQYQLDLYQPVGEHYGVGAGFNLRHLENRSDEGLYNHDFRNLYVSLDASDLWRGGKLSIRGDAWDSDGDDIFTAGFELEQKLEDLVRIRLGTSYSLYRIDLFTGTERERDRVYYAKLRWHLTDQLHLDTSYQYERDSSTEYHTLTTGLRLWF